MTLHEHPNGSNEQRLAEHVVGGNGGYAPSFASLSESCAAVPPHLTFAQRPEFMTSTPKWNRVARWIVGISLGVTLIGSCWYLDFPAIADSPPRELSGAGLGGGLAGLRLLSRRVHRLDLLLADRCAEIRCRASHQAS